MEAYMKREKCTICGETTLCYFNRNDIHLCPECILAMNQRLELNDSSEYIQALVSKYKKSLSEKKRKQRIEKAKNTNNKALAPVEIKKYLDEYVIGQDEAKKALAVALYNHYKRTEIPGTTIEKSNILLMGPTGSGKTLLAKTLAKIMDVPFIIADATNYTETGYVGADVETILTKLLAASDGNIARAERGIVYIDEFDKIGSKNTDTGNKDLGIGVQQALLKLIEGNEIDVPMKMPAGTGTNGGMMPPRIEKVSIDTKNILFICGGSFAAFEEKKKNPLGFGREPEVIKENTEPLLSGIIPELLGRLPVVVHLDPLTEEDLLHVLCNTKNNIIQQYQELFAYDGIELIFTEDALKRIVSKTIEKKLGARGLRSIIETAMRDIMFEIPSVLNVDKCIITAKTIETGIPELTYKASASAAVG